MNHVGNTKMVLHQTCSALATYQPQDQYDLKLSIERAPEDGKKKKQTKEDMAGHYKWRPERDGTGKMQSLMSEIIVEDFHQVEDFHHPVFRWEQRKLSLSNISIPIPKATTQTSSLQ